MPERQEVREGSVLGTNLERRLASGVALSTIFFALSSQFVSASPSFTFSSRVQIDTYPFYTDGRILKISPTDGSLWYAGAVWPFSNSTYSSSSTMPSIVWRSVDGGKSFSPVTLGSPLSKDPNCKCVHLDDDLIIDSLGTIHVASMIQPTGGGTYECIYYWRSTDGGNTFSTKTDYGNGTWSNGASTICHPGVTVVNGFYVDRPWLAYYGGNIYLAYRCLVGICLDISHDGGQSWGQHITAIPKAECNCSAPQVVAGPAISGSRPGTFGYIAVDQSSGSIYVNYYRTVYSGSTLSTIVLKVAASNDGGSTFQYYSIANRSAPSSSPVPMSPPDASFAYYPITVDSAGNVYTVWTDNALTPLNVFLSTSTNRGRTWSQPFQVSGYSQQNLGGANWPWLIAGSAGRIAVSWRGTSDTPAPPSLAPNSTRWFNYLAISTDALSQNPTFTTTQFGDQPFATGTLRCAAFPSCRNYGWGSGNEHMAINMDGSLSFVWPNMVSIVDTSPLSFFTTETSGPTLLAPSTTTTSSTTSTTLTTSTTTSSMSTTVVATTSTSLVTSSTSQSASTATTPTTTTTTTIAATTPSATSTTSTASSQTSSATASTTSAQTTSGLSSSTSSSVSTGGGGIPEFSFQIAAVTILAIVVAASYFIVRRRF